MDHSRHPEDPNEPPGSSLKHKVTRYDIMQDDEDHVLKVKEHEVK